MVALPNSELKESTTNCRLKKGLTNAMQIGTIRFKKVTTVVSGTKDLTRIFISLKRVSTSTF